MSYQILFRKGIAEEGEFKAAKQFFPNTVENRVLCEKNAVIIPRYSALPYYQELEQDLSYQGNRLINTYKQHKFIADFAYYNLVQNHTPKTWFSLAEALADGYHGPFFIKGKTNSRKFEFNTHCYAKDVKEAVEVSSRLYQDSMIGTQGLIYREYVKLKASEIGLNGLPFANEWRFFFLGSHLVEYGYYWSCAENIIKNKYCPQKVFNLAMSIAQEFSKRVNFFVLDIAETQDGRAILIEANDSSMSGLSTIDPNEFYRHLSYWLYDDRWVK